MLGEESCKESPVTADAVGAQGSLFGEQREGNHCWRGKESFARLQFH